MVGEVTTLECSPRALSWLRQFKSADREVARQLLRQLRLVSEFEFDRDIQRLLAEILASVPEQNFALLSVTEPPNKFQKWGGRRTPGASSDRIKHLIENVARVHGERVSANPTIESMRAERIRNIVLVEDFVASGTRLEAFWKSEISKSVKSWISYGWTKIWLVTYAALAEGLRVALHSIKGLDEVRIRTALDPKSSRLGLTPPMEDVCTRYGLAAESGGGGLGFKQGGATLIFQHGCPNNAPLVLWEDGKRFRALFPNRGIPADLQRFFGQSLTLERAELLWKWNQYKLALSLVDSIEQGQASLARWELVVALALSARHLAWDDDWLAIRMRITLDQIRELRKVAYSLHLIDSSSHVLTIFGREMLESLRSSTKKGAARQRASRLLPKLKDLYYPDSCGGRPKHQSSEAT